MIFPVARARDVMLRYRELVHDAPDELGTSGGLSPMSDGPMFFLAVSYCGDRADGERLLNRWIATLRPDTETVKWGAYASELSVPAAPSVGTGRFLPALSDEVVDVFAASLATAPEQASAIWNEYRGAVTRVPLDATAFPLRRLGFDLFLSVPWTTVDERDVAIDWSSRLSDALAPFSHGVYVNNLNETESHRVNEAYGSHYDRLAAIKTRYDPDNFFRVNHNIKPGCRW